MSDELTLPPGWLSTTLDQCAARITDGTHLPPKFVSEGIPFIFVKHIVGGRLSFEGTRFISEATHRELNGRCPVEIGDVLYAAVGSYGVAVAVDTDRPFSFQRHIAHIKPRSDIDAKYLSYCLNSPACVAQAHRMARGVAQKTVTLRDLRRFEVAIAPFHEQRRIVAKIEELFSDLDAGVAALERVRANLKRYRAAVLKAAVEGRLTEEWRTRHPATEPAAKLLERILAERRAKWEQDQLRKFKEAGKTPPKGWRENFEDSSAAWANGLGSLPPGWSWSNIDRIADVQGGIQKQPKRAPVKNAYPYLRVANVRRDQLLLDDVEKFELFPGELERLRLEPNDLLIVEGNGSLTEIGRSAIWRGEIPNCVHQNHIIRVRPLGGVVTGFVNIYWNSPNGAKRVMAEAASTSGLYTLSVTKVCRLPVPIPPLAEQSAIVAEVDRRLSVADAAEQQVEHALQRAARLRQSILKRAFEGKLVPQESADTPLTRSIAGRASGTRKDDESLAKPAKRRSRAHA